MQRLFFKRKDKGDKKALTKPTPSPASGKAKSTVTMVPAPLSYGNVVAMNPFPTLSNYVSEHGEHGLRLSGSTICGQLAVGSLTEGHSWRCVVDANRDYSASLAVDPYNLFCSGSLQEAISGMFSCYEFLRLKFHYVPYCPSTEPGGFVMFYRANYKAIADTTTGECNDPVSGLTYPSSVAFSRWEPATLNIVDLSHKENGFMTVPALATEYFEKIQGQIVVCHTGPLESGTTHTEKGFLIMEYDLVCYGYCSDNTYSLTKKSTTSSDEKEEPVLIAKEKLLSPRYSITK